MNRMRIGISTSVIQRGQTGIAQHLLSLLRALAGYAGQHEFSLFVLEEDMALFDPFRSNMRLVPVPETVRPPVRNIFWHQIELPRLVRRLGLDVLHVPSYRRLLWPKPCPLVATIHDLAPFRVMSKYDPLRMFYGRVIAKMLARRQDHVIAVSQNTARDVTEFFGLPSTRIAVIHNGIDHDRFNPANPETSRAFAADRYRLRQPFFLYVARLEHPGKNHVRLITAFERFKAARRSDWQLALAGSDWNGAEKIHSAIQKSPVARDIYRLGFVPNDRLPDLYRAASAFVYPSLYEGFGMPPVEAMACGCPVITSTRGALAEVVGQAALCIDPENGDDLPCQMERLAASPRLQQKLRCAGFNQAQLFDWRTAAADTLGVYLRAHQARHGLGHVH